MYAIKQTRHFFSPSSEETTYVSDNIGMRISFHTYAEAEWLKQQLDHTPYFAAPNERGKPTYSVRPILKRKE